MTATTDRASTLATGTEVEAAVAAGLRHLDAWSAADPDAVAATAALFTGPGTGTALTDTALREHAADLLARLDGPRFTVRDVLRGATGAALAWTLRARCAATGADVVVDGVDEVRTGPDGPRVVRHHDPAGLPGAGAGEWEHGTATRRADGRTGAVGALSLTRLTVADDAESAEVDRLSVETVRAMWASRGVLGVATFDIGRDKYTVTAFDGVDAVRAVHSRAHQRAMRRFFRSGLCRGAWTGVFSPVRVHVHERCPDCGTTVRTDPASAGSDTPSCPCGSRPAPSRLF